MAANLERTVDRTFDKDASFAELNNGRRNMHSYQTNQYEDERQKKIEMIENFTGKSRLESLNDYQPPSPRKKTEQSMVKKLSTNERIQRDYK